MRSLFFSAAITVALFSLAGCDTYIVHPGANVPAEAGGDQSHARIPDTNGNLVITFGGSIGAQNRSDRYPGLYYECDSVSRTRGLARQFTRSQLSSTNVNFAFRADYCRATIVKETAEDRIENWGCALTRDNNTVRIYYLRQDGLVTYFLDPRRSCRFENEYAPVRSQPDYYDRRDQRRDSRLDGMTRNQIRVLWMLCEENPRLRDCWKLR